MSTVPESIPDDAEVDIPPEGNVDLVRETDPEAAHRRGIDKTKLTFAIGIVIGSLVIVVVLTGLQFFLQKEFPDATELSSAIDWLKVIATTALGFVFGRSTLAKKDE